MKRTQNIFRAVVQPLAIVAVLTVLTFGVTGCGSGPKLGRVEGRVTRNGEPQANLWVKFSPAQGGRPSQARTDSDGRFAIQYKDRAGALVGTHNVVIGSGGEVDARGNPLNRAVELLSTEVQVEGGSNKFDFELNEG